MNYPEIPVISNNPTFAGLAEMFPDVVYSTATGKELKLAVLSPWVPASVDRSTLSMPLIVFVQGSAWTFPNIYFEIPQLSQLARMGFVVATVTHRNALEGHPFPAFLEDVKCAIRFLRAHAAEYGIDKERVSIFGTSSGGNTALLVGLTGDDPRYKTAEYAEESDAVCGVVECFGPANLQAMLPPFELLLNAPADNEFAPIFRGLLGTDPAVAAKRMEEMSPVNHVDKNKTYPLFLLLHGTADDVVPYEQGVEMYHTLLDGGVSAKMVAINGAEHEGSFWSEELWSIIETELRAQLSHPKN